MRLSPQTEQAMLNQGELASLLEIHNDGLWVQPGPQRRSWRQLWHRQHHRVIGGLVFAICFFGGIQLGAWLDRVLL